jgi:hypothetical protein
VTPFREVSSPHSDIPLLAVVSSFALRAGSVNAFISCAHRGFQLLMLPPGPWVKANDFVSENLERATAVGGKPVVAGLVELSRIRAHRLPVPFFGSNSLTK